MLYSALYVCFCSIYEISSITVFAPEGYRRGELVELVKQQAAVMQPPNRKAKQWSLAGADDAGDHHDHVATTAPSHAPPGAAMERGADRAGQINIELAITALI